MPAGPAVRGTPRLCHRRSSPSVVSSGRSCPKPYREAWERISALWQKPGPLLRALIGGLISAALSRVVDRLRGDAAQCFSQIKQKEEKPLPSAERSPQHSSCGGSKPAVRFPSAGHSPVRRCELQRSCRKENALMCYNPISFPPSFPRFGKRKHLPQLLADREAACPAGRNSSGWLEPALPVPGQSWALLEGLETERSTRLL